jgi:hypothetical protein
MGLFDKLKQAFKKPEPTKAEKPKKERKAKEPAKELSDKEKATLAGEPYVNILRMDVDPADLNSGSFELDWNDKFIINLIKAGYKFKDTDTDTMIVDRWFQTVCRNVALEVYDQVIADPDNRDMRNIRQRDIGNGRTEVS